MDGELRAWCEREGLMRYAAIGDEGGEAIELVRGPLVALGPGDGDFVEASHPAAVGYPGKPLATMTLDDYNRFICCWLEAAVAAGDARCIQCGRLILAGDDLPDPETWDAIFVEKELVGWMIVHFDCKKKLAKKLKGLHPFDLAPREAPRYDLSHVEPPAEEVATDAAEHG
ncbi:MAG: hypothetical protein IVW57_19635 [Ktedonobacterales bacterium]|nr:hypothetical protein [Ktedonobacterales bacterium]